MVKRYIQVELQTGIQREQEFPDATEEIEALRFVNLLNKEALTYGCYYYVDLP